MEAYQYSMHRGVFWERVLGGTRNAPPPVKHQIGAACERKPKCSLGIMGFVQNPRGHGHMGIT